MTYDAVVFDMDGVLVEDSPGWVFEAAAEEALRAHGIEPTPEEVDRLSGFPRDVPATQRHFAETHGADLASLWARRERAASANQRRVIRHGGKGAYDDTAVLPSLSADLAVVSNNQHATVETVVRRFGFEDYLAAWVGLEPTLSGVYRRKPDPWYLERAIEAVGAENALYVGDRASDVAAALYAGADAALLTRTGDPADVDPAPTHEITTLSDLPAVVEGNAPAGDD